VNLRCFFCLVFFFSHQLNSPTHLTVAQSKPELLNLSVPVRECTVWQPWNGGDVLRVEVHVSFILGKMLKSEVEYFLGKFPYTCTHVHEHTHTHTHTHVLLKRKTGVLLSDTV